MPSRLSILVADNEQEACRQLQQVLASLGCKADFAHDGPTALELAENCPYDVALLDLRIPGMDGVELFRRLKSLHGDTAIIVTAHAANNTAEIAVGDAAIAVLPKSLEFSRLTNLVDEILEQPLLLVIDDDRALCEGLRDQFLEKGYPVHAAYSLTELRTIFKLDSDDKLLLLNLPLEDRNADELYEIVRDAAPAARIILITEHKSELDHIVNMVMSEGAYDYLLKPINADVLRVSLKRIARFNETTHSLKREADARRQAEMQHRLLAEAMANLGEGVVITNAEFDGAYPQIVFVNDAICRITGYQPEELLRKTPQIFHGDRTCAESINRLLQAIRTERPFQAELVYYRKDGSAYDAEIAVTPLFDANGACMSYVSVHRDVTERNRAARLLRAQEARTRAILNAATDAIVTIDRLGIIESVNPATSRMFGYSEAEMIAQNVKMLMPEPFRTEHDGYLSRYLETGEAQVIGIGREVVARRKDGSTFPVHLAVSRLDNPLLFTGIIRDISALKELQKQILEIAGEEDRRIGQELHDSVQQQLTGLGLLSQTVSDLLTSLNDCRPDNQPIVAKVTQLASRVAAGIDNVSREVHNLSRGLVPVEIDAEGLRAALRELAGRIREQYGVACECRFAGDTGVTNNFVATHLFRIVQEAVTNAIKHGEATRIDITLLGADNSITMEIRDNGCGLGAKPISNLGTGLKIMQYRAGLMGGVFQIAPGPRGGTLVSCTVSTQSSFADEE
ncbi:PAS domain S-box protein [Blastopirellula marina]|uniref:Sensor protein FixL n=1 Tax=Blastopirellula marina TaxID=124 RepID=A0A2S8GHJ7_9BACT|nr:PAS domain S-box protein [Blastopirellula marina]PQO43926.1 hypothetical protein C5Y93_22345 [Blastopirellula marina]